jgi:hypothetical protein
MYDYVSALRLAASSEPVMGQPSLAHEIQRGACRTHVGALKSNAVAVDRVGVQATPGPLLRPHKLILAASSRSRWRVKSACHLLGPLCRAPVIEAHPLGRKRS